MRHTNLLAWMLWMVFALPFNHAQAVGAETPIATWMEGRLIIGARIHHFELKDTRRRVRGRLENTNIRGNFVGSVWGLDEIQHYVPRLYVLLLAVPYVGAGVTFDQVSAETVDWGDEEKSFRATDGDLETWGPTFFVQARWPNASRFTPFAEWGRTKYFADFKEDPDWAAVAPGYRFEVDDTYGTMHALGCEYAITPNWSVHAYWRRLRGASVAARAYFTPGPRVGRAGAFPIEYDMYALGTSYHF